jgi:predicted metal-dependent hydrolase
LFAKQHSLVYKNKILKIESPSGSKIELEEIYNFFLKNKAASYITDRTKKLAFKFGFNIKEIRIRGQKTRWGSCSSKGNLSFNYKLLKFNKEIIDYVIIHELCHLKEMNHSQNFWRLVRLYSPGYRELKKELKKIPS